MEKPRPRFDPHAMDATPRRRITPSHLTDPAEWRYGFRWGIGMFGAGIAIVLVLVTLVAAGVHVHPEAARQLTAAYMSLLFGGLVVGSASVITRKTRNGQREILLDFREEARSLREELRASQAVAAARDAEMLRLLRHLAAQVGQSQPARRRRPKRSGGDIIDATLDAAMEGKLIQMPASRSRPPGAP